jgi:ectoine utilization protein EutC
MKQPMMVLNEAEIRRSVSLNDEALAEVSKGFTALAKGEVTLPSILRIDIPENHGEVDVKTAYIHGLDSFAIKIAAGFFNNNQLGLPTGSGMMVLISAITGYPTAILLDNGYLTDVRTGIAGAIAAKHLARKEIDVVGVFGSGMQARYQVRALRLVRDFSKLMVYGIIPEEVDAYAKEMSTELDIEVIQSKEPESVVRQSEIVITTTPSKEPYLQAEWLHPGLHITCMGSDSEDKQELYSDVFTRADMIVCDKKSQVFRLGELHHAKDAGLISEDQVSELGELTSGEKAGRESEDAITVCDLTGVGIQDTQIARLAYRKAIDHHFGLAIE